MYEPNVTQKSDTRILYLILAFLNLTVSDINKTQETLHIYCISGLGSFVSSHQIDP
jgi:hypothetical protein